ncbi:MAG TPA: hypothetical protein VKE69_02865, partial [Planctomycetota bacterium]|nr:hypothetical protein [Planctomycetota bacterium]
SEIRHSLNSLRFSRFHILYGEWDNSGTVDVYVGTPVNVYVGTPARRAREDGIGTTIGDGLEGYPWPRIRSRASRRRGSSVRYSPMMAAPLKRKSGRRRLDPTDSTTHLTLALPTKQYDAFARLATRHAVSVPEVIRRALAARPGPSS